MTDVPVSALPAPRDDDDDDVAWALQTAAVQWQRGSPGDAIGWLRRAVDSAIQIGANERASELNKAAAALTELLLEGSHPSPAATPTAAPAVSGDSQSPASRAEVDALVDDEAMVVDQAADLREDMDDIGADEAAMLLDDVDETSDAHGVDEVQELEGEEIGDEAIVEVVDDDDIVEEDDEADEADEDTPAQGRALRDEVPFAPDVEASVEELDDGVHTSAPESPSVERRPSEPPSLADALEPENSPEATVQAMSIDWQEDEEDAGQEQGPEAGASEEAEETEAPDTENQASQPPPSRPPEQPATEDAAPPSQPGEPAVEGVDLFEVEGIQDLPEDSLLELARAAELRDLGREEELGNFGMAVVTRGEVAIMATILDSACATIGVGQAVFTRGTMDEGVSLRVVAQSENCRVAVWKDELLHRVMEPCPWVRDELAVVADRFQAMAGITMGPLGERLDASLRQMITDRSSVRKLLSEEVLITEGDPVDGMYVVGAGGVEVEKGGRVTRLGPGDFLFAQQVMAGGKADATVRAGSGGALMLVTDRMAAHELLVSVPPLLEILASS